MSRDVFKARPTVQLVVGGLVVAELDAQAQTGLWSVVDPLRAVFNGTPGHHLNGWVFKVVGDRLEVVATAELGIDLAPASPCENQTSSRPDDGQEAASTAPGRRVESGADSPPPPSSPPAEGADRSGDITADEFGSAVADAVHRLRRTGVPAPRRLVATILLEDVVETFAAGGGRS